MEPTDWNYRTITRVLNQVNDGLERLAYAMGKAESLIRQFERMAPDSRRIREQSATEPGRPAYGARTAEVRRKGRSAGKKKNV